MNWLPPSAHSLVGSTTVVACLCAWLACVDAWAQAPAATRFLAIWGDGSRTTGPEIVDWSWVDKQPRLNNQLLFDAGNRVRWLRDTTLDAPLPPAQCLEFFGGDRLPGRLVGFAPGVELPAIPLPPHLLVEPMVAVDRPRTPTREMLKVVPDQVQRVIWQRLPRDRYVPSTVFCKDGRSIEYRSLRWQELSIRLLTDQGALALAFDEIAELHLPQQDAWEALFARRAVLSPGGQSTWLTLSTVEGLTATTSLERFEARSDGREGDPGAWIHAVQPAWSLESLFIPHRKIRQRIIGGMHEVALTTIPPVRMAGRTILSAGWKQPRLDANVQGGPLISGGLEFGWGFGVHAHQELEFELPPAARTFRTRFGLDRVIGGGGCVRGIVYHGSTQNEPLFESKLLVGSDQVIDTGRMALAPTIMARSRLILVADAAERQTPRGADPLDVRDVCDWLEPIIDLNPQDAFVEITSRARLGIPEWDAWRFSAPDLEGWKLTTFKYPQHFRAVGQFEGTEYSFKRRLHVDPERDQLAIRLTHPDRKVNPGKLIVVVEGAELRELPVAVTADLAGAAAQLVSLADYAGREVDVELRLVLTAGSILDFRGATMVALPESK